MRGAAGALGSLLLAPLIHLGGGSALIGELLDGLLGCVAFVINLGHFLFGLLLREQLRSSGGSFPFLFARLSHVLRHGCPGVLLASLPLCLGLFFVQLTLAAQGFVARGSPGRLLDGCGDALHCLI